MGCKGSRAEALSMLPVVQPDGSVLMTRQRAARKKRKSTAPRAIKDFHCPRCGLSVPGIPNYRHRCPGEQPVGYQVERDRICGECPHNRGGVCLPLQMVHPDKPCLVDVGAVMPGVRCPLAKWERVLFHCDRCGSSRFDAAGLSRCPTCHPSRVARQSPAGKNDCPIHDRVSIPRRQVRPLPDGAEIVTFHFNPHGRRRLRETYYEWLPTLGYPVKCYELVMGDAEPEIDGSIVLRGDADHALWQKERMVNLALSQLEPSVRYVAWVDHDMVFADSRWLEKSVEMLAGGVDALQPYSTITYLDLQRRRIYQQEGAVATFAAGRTKESCPGAAWVARRDFLDRIGGIYEKNIVGGGDAVWFSGMTGHRTQFLKRQPPAVRVDAMHWIESVGTVNVGHLQGGLFHLWHGSRKNRQYVERDAMLVEHGVDPAVHVEIGKNGLLRWTGAAPPAMRQAVSDYFAARRDDG